MTNVAELFEGKANERERGTRDGRKKVWEKRAQRDRLPLVTEWSITPT